MSEDDIFDEDFDPMRDLEELKMFASIADAHITSLLNNQKVLVESINELRKDILRLTQILNEFVGEDLDDEID